MTAGELMTVLLEIPLHSEICIEYMPKKNESQLVALLDNDLPKVLCRGGHFQPIRPQEKISPEA